MSSSLDIGFGPGKWGDDDWNTVVDLGIATGQDRSLIAVKAAFAFLLLVGMLVLSSLIYVLKRSRSYVLKPMPLIATLAAMFSMVASMANMFAYCNFGLTVSTTKKWYLITSLLSALFEQASYCIMFYVFYAIVHVFQERIMTMSTRVSSTIKYVHWVIVGLFAALVIIEWSWMVLYINSTVHDELIFTEQYNVWGKIDSARCILFWLSAWEIVGWAFYLGLMTSRGSSKVNIKMSSFFFIAACGFFLGVNFLFFVWDVIYYLKAVGETAQSESAENVSIATAAIEEILQFVFVQGSFFGLILCYWRFPEPEARFEEVSSGEIEEAKSGSGALLDRTGLAPREVEGSTPLNGITEKKVGVFEADTSRAILEADNSDYLTDKKAGISEVDGSNGVLEADSTFVHEVAT
ncbi:hypothetical protein N7481_010851 [Penicillium waksmanii]|uniref:uncharacterized protein n=1 Tax=Penicillium waksmanii TaxID=69791 RepID=UPI00254957D2|nr:uncharacterized protein N7481_010851 [Penicillium waksmanii]KAJ5973641.1 hypothetical protein N7481_010851 [Penicillium waksmanii]